MAAADEAEVVHMVATAVQIDDGPCAFRYPRGEGVGVELPERGVPLEIGKGRIVREGTKIALLSFGARLAECLKAAEELEARGLSTTVADARFAKPLDHDLILRLAREHEALVTIEVGAVGGFGSHVLQLLATDADLEGPTDESGQPIVDARTGLAPALPPLWVDWPAVPAFAANDLDSADPATPRGRLAHLYRAAARIEAGWDNDQILADRQPGASPGDARFARGVELVELIVLARVGNRDERALARDRLRQRLTPDAPRWEQAWVRCAIGR